MNLRTKSGILVVFFSNIGRHSGMEVTQKCKRGAGARVVVQWVGLLLTSDLFNY